MESNIPVKLSEEVTKAKVDGIPIVCLESTVFSQLGLPSPSNAEALELCMSTLKNNDVVFKDNDYTQKNIRIQKSPIIKTNKHDDIEEIRINLGTMSTLDINR